ncbi:MAG: 3'(2'),5'-bisphosphate nucleotidase CysQ, partial [Gammaproteobacteria bacterium]|nr:3'(2'),5'-bisphosphate nucleotidase CysQ [Gammaproteobacteria bacterium]
NSPLTEADLAAHRHIVDSLRQLTPDWPVLSEESAAITPAERRQWQRFWLVDPLDGTREFIKRNGEFTVNIALIDHHEPVLGVVFAPAKQIEFFGACDHGAFRRDGNGVARGIRVAAAHDGPVRIVGSRSHRGDSLERFLARVGEHEMVPMGSSLKICLVADGSADVYPRLGPTSEWDTAAAHAVLVAAGGQLTNVAGESLRYNARDELLNPHFLAIGGDQRDWLTLLS